MSKIELEPLEEGDNVPIPLTKTTIGRGPFLQVADKRVSRNHATLEVNDDGDLVLTPIHTNPCFLKEPGSDEQSTLPKDKPQILEHGDIFGLLPDKLFYKVVYLDKSKHKIKEEEESDTTDDEKPSVNGDGDSNKVRPVKLQKKGKEMAMPLDKKRPLPDWMVGAAKRQGGGAKVTPKKAAPKKAAPKPAPKPKAPASTPNRGRPKGSTKKAKMSSEEEEEESEEEESEEELRKPARGRAQRATRRRKSPSDDDFDSDENCGKRRPRLGRQASKNKRYSDDFVISDEDVMASDSEEDKKKDSDGSDFNADDIDSGSDWEEEVEEEKGSGRRGSRGGRGGRRRRDSDSFSEDDFRDSYKPRLSKRRAAAKKRYRDDSEEEDSDEDFSEKEIVPKRKRGAKKTPKKTPARKRRKQESEDEFSEESESEEKKPKKRGARKATSSKKYQDESEEEEAEEENNKTAKGKKKKESDNESEEESKPKKKDGPRRPCMFGKNCYRKNPIHFKEFSHPGDSSYDEDEAAERRVNPKPRRKIREIREKDEKSILRGDGDDDGEANTYDYGDSFLNDEDVSEEESETFDPAEEDSDYEPGEEDDIKQLKKEAKSFVRNKKLVKPARSK